MTISAAAGRSAAHADSVEGRGSWIVALTALGIYSVSFGAPVITIVALKPIAAELGGARSVPALAYSLAWLGLAPPVAVLPWAGSPSASACAGP